MIDTSYPRKSLKTEILFQAEFAALILKLELGPAWYIWETSSSSLLEKHEVV